MVQEVAAQIRVGPGKLANSFNPAVNGYLFQIMAGKRSEKIPFIKHAQDTVGL